MTAICPSGYTLENGKCYTLCPNGTESSTMYPDYCISTVACQNGTIQDTTGLACTKVAPTGIIDKNTNCPTGYTEWTTGSCYINCNSYFLENGPDCRKRLLFRRTTEPYCDNYFQYVLGNNCKFDYTRFLVCIVGALFLGVVYFQSMHNPILNISNK